MKKTIIALLLLSNISQGIETDKVAHASTSFVLQTVCYGLAKKFVTDDRFQASALAAVLVFAATTFKEFNDNPTDSHDILANTIGIGTAIGATFVFEF